MDETLPQISFFKNYNIDGQPMKNPRTLGMELLTITSFQSHLKLKVPSISKDVLELSSLQNAQWGGAA